MLPKSYGEVLEAAGRSVDRLARGVEQLMRLPAELLPLLAAQRAGAAAAGAGAGAAPAGGAGVLSLAAHKGPAGKQAAMPLWWRQCLCLHVQRVPADLFNGRGTLDPTPWPAPSQYCQPPARSISPSPWWSATAWP